MDGRVGHDDRVLDVAVRVHADARGQDAARDLAAGDDASHRDQGPRGLAAAALLVEHELGGRELRLVGAQRPFRVVQVEHGVDLDQVHRRLVVGVQRPHVAPVLRGLLVLVPEQVREHPLAAGHQLGDDVAAEVVGRPFLRVLGQLAHQHVGVEDVDAHGAERVVGVPGRRGRGGRLLLEAGDAAVLVDLEDAEAARLRGRDLDRAHRQHRPAGDVDVEHLPVVHLVDVVPGQDDHPARPLALQRVQVLVHRVRGAEVPVLPHPLLRGEDLDELAELGVDDAPAHADVPVQALRLVLAWR